MFPVISASDDRLRLADICTASVPQSPALDGHHASNVVPSPPLEDPEHGQTPTPVAVFRLALVSLLPQPLETVPFAACFAYRSLGRAPPCHPARA
jgi:hypothetical protein